MNDKFFIATTGNGISRAAPNGGGNWSVESLLTGQNVTCLASNPLNPHIVYAGTEIGGVLRSNDHGKTWQSLGLAERVIRSIAVSAIEHDTIYVGTKPANMFVSRDGGACWTELDAFKKIPSRRFWFSPAGSLTSAYVLGIALSPADPDIIVAGIEFGAVVRSADGGKTWQDHRPGALRDSHTVYFHPINKDWVYEGGGSGTGVSFSRDAGDCWMQPKAGLDRHYGWACVADPAQPDLMYASLSTDPFRAHSENNAQAFIFRSMNGSGWQKLGGGLPQPLNHMPYALVTDVSAPGYIYAGLSNGDVWQSADRGDRWQKLPFNLMSINRAMVIL